jgi:hypothetical protein
MNMKFIDDARIPDHPYPELREVLKNFAGDIESELAGNLTGIYLVGSIATGDFDLDSDVDFLVVTNTGLTEANMRSLQDIQIKIHKMDCYPAKHLEGSYISLADLNDRSAVGEKKLFYFDNGSTAHELSTHDNKWHVRWILRERGITLAGRKPAEILQPIPSNEMAGEIKTTMFHVLELFQDEINNPPGFWNSRFGQSFAVLTCCRMLHSLQTGTVQSKKAGMMWAKQFVEPEWRNIIDQAWKEREGVRFLLKIGQRAEPAVLQETLEFIHYAVARMDSIRTGAG